MASHYYWFSSTTLFSAILSFMFPAYLALVGIRNSVSRTHRCFLIILTMVFTVLQWGMAAHQAEDASLHSVDLEKSLKTAEIQKKELNESLEKIQIQNRDLEAQNKDMSENLKKIAGAIHVNFDIPNQILSTEIIKKIEEITKKVSARNIDPKTSKNIIQELKVAGSPSIIVTAILGDSESLQYATNIVDILKKASWRVEGPNQSVFMSPLIGLHIEVTSREHAPLAGFILYSVFKKHGIETVGNINPQVKPDTLNLIVGSKPQ